MKNLIVQKYGGSSVADVGRIKNVAKRIARSRKAGNKVVVVVSALGDTTDELFQLVKKITSEPSEREMDMLLSTGEQVSAALLTMAIHTYGIDAVSFTGAQVKIITDKSHTKARILDIDAGRIKAALKKGKVVIVAGFQGMNADEDITTLGRGGSDLTAVALATALDAERCEIYTDVDGVYTADPRIVKNAKRIRKISYEEMLEFASLGAQVMQARSIEVAGKFDIPIRVRSSFNNKEGTLICKEVKAMEEVLVRGITVDTKEAKLTICDVTDKPGFAAKIFRKIAENDINVDMIIQNTSRTGRTDISFTIPAEDIAKAKAVIRKTGAGDIIEDKNVAKVSVVGIGMRSHSGVAAKMFAALASKRINIDMISTSEIKISCVVQKDKAKEAMRVIHKAFGLGK